MPRSIGVALVAAGQLHHIYAGREHLPDLDAFTRFELPTVGRIYDADGEPLVELADQYRDITHYDEIPPVVRRRSSPPKTSASSPTTAWTT